MTYLRISEADDCVKLHFDEAEVEFTHSEFRYFLDCMNNLNNFPIYKEWRKT